MEECTTNMIGKSLMGSVLTNITGHVAITTTTQKLFWWFLHDSHITCFYSILDMLKAYGILDTSEETSLGPKYNQ